MQLRTPYFFLLVALPAFFSAKISAAPYFNPAALVLNGDEPLMDLAQFQYLRERQFQEEGHYFVTVRVNQRTVSGQWLEFRYHPQQKTLLPTLTRRQWLVWGLRPDASPAFAATDHTEQIKDIAALVSGVTLHFDAAQQALDITIPQRFFLTDEQRGGDAALWEPGITAFMLNYDYRFSRSSSRFSHTTGHTLSLKSGFNAGFWRLRHHSRAEHRNGKMTWQSERVWMYRAIPRQRSELQLGELFSSDVLFDNRYGNSHNPLFAQGTAAYGINSFLTLYGGMSAAHHALSSGAGAGINMGAAGGVSADMLLRHASAKQTLRYRINYQAFFPPAGTLFNAGAGYEQHARQWQTRLAQPLPGDNGVISAGYHYNRTGRRDRPLISRDAGYFSHIGRMHYGVNAQYRTGGHYRKADKRVSVSLSVPLDFAGQQARSHFQYHNQAGKSSFRTSAHGLLGDEGRFGYSVTHHQRQSAAHYRGAELRWRHDLADIRGRAGHSHGQRTLSEDIQGGLIIHENGITLSRPLGETNGLADTGGTGGVRVASRTAARTDHAGFSVIPQLNHYYQNVIRIDPETLPDNADADNPVVQVIPSKGAVVPVRFAVSTGFRAIFALRTPGGVVPFAARIQVKKTDGSTVSGITGDDGEVYLSGLPAQGRLQVVWGEGMHRQCEADFTIPPEQQGLITLPLMCR